MLDPDLPGIPGTEVLRRIRQSPDLSHLPVIPATSDAQIQTECLKLGADDFFSRPYPSAAVLQLRVKRVIQMNEDRKVLLSAELDPLTGLHTRPFFYRRASQLDRHGTDMDAIVLNIDHFSMINERHGRSWADLILKCIGKQLHEIIENHGGICCRSDADTFLAYCPHGLDLQNLYESISTSLGRRGRHRVHLRIGVYENADKSLEIERRFDHAKSAADAVRSSFTNAIGKYDEQLHAQEIFSQQLIEDFHPAIAGEQFQVFFQPKYDIRPDKPVLSSAEALVRWQHPRLGQIRPDVFIPLFEENGLIKQLDSYVWKKTAQQIRVWKDRSAISLPISVNVSRIDMYDPKLTEEFNEILKEYHLDSDDLRLEITESAYTRDSSQIVTMVNRLRNIGFHIEMDDFGSGYSSLNMISNLPIDLLKLDRQFIVNGLRNEHESRLIEIVIDIARYLNVPTVAEGVETEEQLQMLRKMRCTYVQGYYFSRPVPASEFEAFLKDAQG